MKIRWYSHYFTPEIGAPSARIYDFSQQWLRQGHSVGVATCFPNHPVGRVYPGYRRRLIMRESLDGLQVKRSWTYITPNKGFVKKLMGHVSFMPSTLLMGGGLLDAPDVVIGTSPTFFAAMAGAAAGHRCRAPFVMEVRDLWPAIFIELGVLKNPLLIRILEQVEMRLYRTAARVITVTEAFRQNLVQRGIDSAKVVTIRNGADLDFWQPGPPSRHHAAKLGFQDKFIVLYIGAHGISHALGKMLSVAERLKRHTDIRFLFVGEGAEKSALMQKAREKQLPNVTFLPPVDKDMVREYYRRADVCLVPLRDIPLFKTFIPSKMFEIMAMARPMIGSLRGEAADIMRESRAGIVVAPEDAEAIANAVLTLHKDRAAAASMGNNGRAFVERHYSRRQLADQYLQVLESAVGDAAAAPKGEA